MTSTTQSMSEKPTSQVPASTLWANYAPGRVPYPNGSAAYNQINGQNKYNAGFGPAQLVENLAGLGLSGQNQINTTQQYKANTMGSGQGTVDFNGVGRTYNGNSLMFLPRNQSYAVPAMYAQQQNSMTDQSAQLQYIPNGMFSNILGSPNMVPGALSGYNWQYPGVAGDVPGLGPNRSSSLSSAEEVYPMTPVVGAPGQGDYYNGIVGLDRSSMSFPYGSATSSTLAQQYIAGPIQPMKCADNKSYEMINLDELVQRDPPIPRAVPALWTNQDDLSLAKCLQNPEGITNIYIRGFMPDTTDEDLHQWASRFGEIESCKAIIDMETNKCKGFGFVMYYSPASAENCIRGFFHLGFQASYAQKSRNSRLKDLEDKSSTNIYCTGVPVEWNESDLGKHFLPYQAVSTKICRDAPSGVSKEVGFARFESREVAERVIKDFHSITADIDGIKLYLRFADTKAQKQLKQESQKRRSWRSHEYAYSVEHTPSPTMGRLHNVTSHFSPAASHYQSPADNSTGFTPATSVSPPEANGTSKNTNSVATNVWPVQGGLQSIGNTPTARGPIATIPARNAFVDTASSCPMTIIPIKPALPEVIAKIKTPSPNKKIIIKIEDPAGKENVAMTPQSTK